MRLEKHDFPSQTTQLPQRPIVTVPFVPDSFSKSVTPFPNLKLILVLFFAGERQHRCFRAFGNLTDRALVAFCGQFPDRIC